MTQYAEPEGSTSATSYDEPTGWVGWIVFAAVMMIMLGCFHAIQGLVALFDDQKFLVADNGLIVSVNYTTWGWVHLIGGIIIALAGISLFAGRMWARVVGVLAALVSAIVNIAFLSAYPIWSTIMIAVDILIIWALTVHGAPGNSSADQRRRGLALRFTGDDARYDPHPGTFRLLRDPGIAPGAPMDCELFPRVRG